MEATGAYIGDRAAALSGVPRSTVYHWARTTVLVPSVSRERVQLWSYGDLIGLRIIYWLRQPKCGESGREIPATSMSQVRRALAELKRINLPLWTPTNRCSVAVDRGGHVFITGHDSVPRTPEGQLAFSDVLDLLAPFDTADGTHGPDLVRPRPALRIIPGKLAGSPHIEDTRIETCAIDALRAAGYPLEKIARLYPYLGAPQIADSIDLEAQLKSNLVRAA
jgi:uncharacterized protein (DUF433 family)